MEREKQIITEKYRPKSLDQFHQSDNICVFFDNIVKSNDIPNLLLYGPPGTGKTTASQILARSITKNDNILHLNASDDKDLQTLRNKIMSTLKFSATGKKIIIMDEADALTYESQLFLSKIIEINKNIVYILICNYISKIINKLSLRFIVLKFNHIDYDRISNICENIINKEKDMLNNKKIDFDINYYYNYYNKDLRKILLHMQKKMLNISYEDNKNISDNDLIINSNKYNLLIKANKLINKGLTVYDLIEFIFNKCKDEKIYSNDIFCYLYNQIYNMYVGANEYVQIISLLINYNNIKQIKN